MISRGAFFLVAVFWVAMNVLLWRAEYGPRNGGMPVPLDLVCRKILTAPDPSSMSVYQDGQRMGFCAFSTSVEQEMAKLNEDQPPPVLRLQSAADLPGQVQLLAEPEGHGCEKRAEPGRGEGQVGLQQPLELP